MPDDADDEKLQKLREAAQRRESLDKQSHAAQQRAADEAQRHRAFLGEKQDELFVTLRDAAEKARSSAGLDIQNDTGRAGPIFRLSRTSHVAGISTAHVRRGTDFAANNVLRLLSEQVPKAVLNPEAIPGWSAKFGIEEARYGGTVYYASRKKQHVKQS
jgi:hypothetical protein